MTTTTVEKKKRLERQRLAWVIILGSFSICMVITIAIPFLMNATVQNATEQLGIYIQSNQGTVAIDDDGEGRQAVIAGEIGGVAEPDQTIRTGNTATGLMTISYPDSEELLARLQIYSNSEVHIEEASTPFFGFSSNENAIRLRLENGRIRVTLAENETRPTTVQILTPQGSVNIAEPGEHAIIVTNEDTQVTVQDGTAEIVALAEFNSDPLILNANERGTIPTGEGPMGPLETSRNLIKNGNFDDGVNSWTEFPWTVEIPTEPEGQMRVLDAGGESRINITRQGTGHADVLMRQNIGQDVSELENLRLLITFRILQQSLDVCGVVGSECPFFIRINYIEDESGLSNTWQQGFYSKGEASPGLTPDICERCAMVQNTHERVPAQQDVFFDIDLNEELLRQGRLTPKIIESIVLVFSGHEFEIEVVDVALIAEE